MVVIAVDRSRPVAASRAATRAAVPAVDRAPVVAARAPAVPAAAAVAHEARTADLADPPIEQALRWSAIAGLVVSGAIGQLGYYGTGSVVVAEC